MRLGARPGCAVTIGDVTFDWEPQTPTGIDAVMTRRGTDARLENTDRVGADERKARPPPAPSAACGERRG